MNTSHTFDPDTDEAVIAAGQRDVDAGHDEGSDALAELVLAARQGDERAQAELAVLAKVRP